jgi:hypothetical protein
MWQCHFYSHWISSLSCRFIASAEILSTSGMLRQKASRTAGEKFNVAFLSNADPVTAAVLWHYNIMIFLKLNCAQACTLHLLLRAKWSAFRLARAELLRVLWIAQTKIPQNTVRERFCVTDTSVWCTSDSKNNRPSSKTGTHSAGQHISQPTAHCYIHSTCHWPPISAQ